MDEISIREQICEIGHDLWIRGMVAANDGNIYVLHDDGTIITTPSGISKKFLVPDILCHMTMNNEVIFCPDGYKPSSEFKMHIRCYRERKDIRAVVHAHPPTATGFAVAGISLDDYSVSEAVMTLGSVPVAPFAVPGSDEVPDSIAPFLKDHDAVLLANHGALTVGIDLTQAYYRMETLEHYAKTLLTAKILGGEKEIPADKIKACCDLSKGYPVRHPGYKKYN
ncbi:MAG: class II aldolase/adducin family protein [Ruminiclostridium sp.]|nr:class II aldolase/adducin family protein [Ruminiclostridium sp.]